MDAKRVIKGTPEYLRIYEKALKWWEFWKFPAPPMEFLPVNMVCAYDGDRPICIGFLYFTDSQISWMEWIVADNTASKEERSQAIEYVLTGSKLLADALGFKCIFTCARNQSLQSKLEKKFTKTDERMTHYVWRV